GSAVAVRLRAGDAPNVLHRAGTAHGEEGRGGQAANHRPVASRARRPPPATSRLAGPQRANPARRQGVFDGVMSVVSCQLSVVSCQNKEGGQGVACAALAAFFLTTDN